MAISKEKLPQSNNPADVMPRKSGSSRPSGVAGIPMSSRPSGVDGRGYVDSGTISDELGYGRIVRIVKAVSK